MNATHGWRNVHDFWFPAGLDADAKRLREMFFWWFGGGSNAALKPFAPLAAEARAGRLDAWCATAQGRLALIVVLDQFPRGLFAGSPEAYAGDAKALAIAEEGLRNGHFRSLARDCEKTFFLMPLGHTEGPDHVERLTRVVAIAEEIAEGAPEALKPLYLHSVSQARANLELIERFGRFPHRNAILGRSSTPEEQAYVEKGDFVHRRKPPPV
jgi:uncharacterized protein (DUF924 family)